MMRSVKSVAFFGSDARIITVECDIANGLPQFSIVWLPDASVQESRERVRSAIKNSSFTFPAKRVTLNLAPTSLRKSGSSFDLPIATAVLSGEQNWKSELLENALFFGELGLDGALKPTSWALPACILAKKSALRYVFLPKSNLKEAAYVSGIVPVGIENLKELDGILTSGWIPEVENRGETPHLWANYPVTLEQIRWQRWAKRALEIALAWGHHILLSGPPGSGKSLLAQSCASLLPEMKEEEMLEISAIHSIAGLLSEEYPIVANRPLRTVYHTASPLSLAWGGSHGRPGEMALAHRGILFLDEFLEFDRKAIEILREPLESKEVRITRVSGSYRYPADFSLIATTNPCPCGYLSDPEKECSCTPSEIARYASKLSGPIADRIDLYVQVPRLKAEELQEEPRMNNDSQNIRTRIERARKLSYERLWENRTNSSLTDSELRKFATLSNAAGSILTKATEELWLSGRSYFRAIKVARTIADLDEEKEILPKHIAEALAYRKRENP